MDLTNIKSIKDLFVEHEYYCSDSVWNANGPNHGLKVYKTWEDFFDESKDLDKDYNLLFRWDVYEGMQDGIHGSEGEFYLALYFMQQRKGLFWPVIVEKVEDKHVQEIVVFLVERFEYLKTLWLPFQ